MKRRQEPKTIPVNDKILGTVKKVIAAAIKYEKVIGRKMAITAEVGEVLCCHKMGLLLCADERCEGFDAVDSSGKRVQIKSRRSEKLDLPRDAGRAGQFSKKHKFNYALLVLLSRKYEVHEIWRAEFHKLFGLIEKQKKSGPPITSFKKVGKKIWPSP